MPLKWNAWTTFMSCIDTQGAPQYLDPHAYFATLAPLLHAPDLVSVDRSMWLCCSVSITHNLKSKLRALGQELYDQCCCLFIRYLVIIVFACVKGYTMYVGLLRVFDCAFLMLFGVLGLFGVFFNVMWVVTGGFSFSNNLLGYQCWRLCSKSNSC